MRVAVMQPYFLPYIGYYQLINYVDKFVIYDDVTFINRGWINRNKLLSNGEEVLFTIPLVKASQNKLIREIKISPDNKWRKKLLKTIEYSYKKAPYFEEVFPLISGIVNYNNLNLSTYLYNSFIKVFEYLEINTKIIPSSSIYNNQKLKGQYRILDICKKENADEYVNPPGGKAIYTRQLFTEENINLWFIESKSVTYKQFDNHFVPGLSILDIMMFNSKEKINNYLNSYKLT